MIGHSFVFISGDTGMGILTTLQWLSHDAFHSQEDHLLNLYILNSLKIPKHKVITPDEICIHPSPTPGIFPHKPALTNTTGCYPLSSLTHM